MPQPRALRIGILLGDTMVEERIVTGPATLGQSLRCTLSLPIDGLPREHLLFACDEGRFVLHPLPTMTGRLGQHGAIAELAAHPVTLERGVRGKLAIGDATILFQEVAAPAFTPRPRLPASVRGTLADRVDRRLAVIIGGSLIAHLGLAVWAWATDVDTGNLLESRFAEQYRQDTIDAYLPDFQPQPAQPGVASPARPTIQTPRPIVHPTEIVAPRLPDRDDASRLAAILTSSEPGAHGPADLSHRQPGADLDKQIEEARGRHITIGDDGHTSRRDDRAALGTVHGPDLALQPQALVDTTADHRTEDPNRRFKLDHVKANDDTLLTSDIVLAKINTAYMTGLQRCYRKALVADATLSGRVSISFTVDHHGRVSEPVAAGVNEELDTCIAGQLASWHFPIPTDRDGAATEASFQIGLVLRPS